jgi:hypothetical protein
MIERKGKRGARSGAVSLNFVFEGERGRGGSLGATARRERGGQGDVRIVSHAHGTEGDMYGFEPQPDSMPGRRYALAPARLLQGLINILKVKT